METKFPDSQGYEGLFLVGLRKDPANSAVIQRTGTVVLKRSYDIDPAAEELSPSATARPVFMQDQPDNLLLNSDFESDLLDGDGNPIDWVPQDGTSISQAVDPADSELHILQVSGNASGRVVQTLTFEKPLGGRHFVFSFHASADAPAQIRNARLEADGDGAQVVICNIDESFPVLPALNRSWSTGTWPADLKATQMRVVLRMATSAARTVYYDNVQVEERSYATRYDPATTMLYESDLAAFKPESDVIVLGFATVSGISSLHVNGSEWMTHDVPGGGPPPETPKALFGWEPRIDSPRKEEAGTYDPLPSDPLPDDFSNLFYNGHRRPGEKITVLSPQPEIPRDGLIEIMHGAVAEYRFRLRGDNAAAFFYYFAGSGPDEAGNWRRESIPIKLDTLVIEPENNCCYLVWRGVWVFDRVAEDAYRRLVVQASA